MEIISKVNTYQCGLPHGTTGELKERGIKRLSEVQEFATEIASKLSHFDDCYLYQRSGLRQRFDGYGKCSDVIICGNILNPNSIKAYLGSKDGRIMFSVEKLSFVDFLIRESKKDPISALATFSTYKTEKEMQDGMNIFRTRKGQYMYNK